MKDIRSWDQLTFLLGCMIILISGCNAPTNQAKETTENDSVQSVQVKTLLEDQNL